MLEFISQAGILLFGTSSILLVAKNNKWGFVHGFISQFFFIFTAQQHRQMGIFFLSMIEILLWSYGIYCWFFKKQKVQIPKA